MSFQSRHGIHSMQRGTHDGVQLGSVMMGRGGGGGDPGVGKRRVRKIGDAESSGSGYWDQGLRPT